MPTERVRTRLPQFAELGTPSSPYYASMHWNAEYFWESSYPGPCACFHVKHEKSLTYMGDDGLERKNWPAFLPPIPNPTSLNWGKLPTSTKAGLIQLLAEWDDTIAIFTQKFWKSLTYGSFTWGVLPFVSDAKSVFKTLAHIGDQFNNLSYEDSYQETFHYVNKQFTPNQYYTGDLDCRYHLQGSADISFSGIEAFLDRIGLHPDLATAWDLVPLSFVVDWFIPIGDFLEDLRRGGWVKVVYFNGWMSCAFNWNGFVEDRPPGRFVGRAPFWVTGYKRTPYSQVLVVPSKIRDVEATEPSYVQLFNTAYNLGAGKRVVDPFTNTVKGALVGKKYIPPTRLPRLRK